MGSKSCFVVVSLTLVACQGQTNNSETEAVRGGGSSISGTTLCTVDSKPFESDGPAQQAPVTLKNGEKTWVGASIKVAAYGDLVNINADGNVKAKVLAGTNSGEIVTFKRVHLACPEVKSKAAASGSATGSVEKNIPWPNIYRCKVESANPPAYAIFKDGNGASQGVGNTYTVAVPTGEINNQTINVYVLKGGVVAAGSKGTMQRADLGSCEEDKSL